MSLVKSSQEILKPIETSWEVFDECPVCYTPPKGPCYNLKKSTSKKLIINKNPHRFRRMLKK